MPFFAILVTQKADNPFPAEDAQELSVFHDRLLVHPFFIHLLSRFPKVGLRTDLAHSIGRDHYFLHAGLRPFWARYSGDIMRSNDADYVIDLVLNDEKMPAIAKDVVVGQLLQ
jgi:hypothetical protein